MYSYVKVNTGSFTHEKKTSQAISTQIISIILTKNDVRLSILQQLSEKKKIHGKPGRGCKSQVTRTHQEDKVHKFQSQLILHNILNIRNHYTLHPTGAENRRFTQKIFNSREFATLRNPILQALPAFIERLCWKFRLHD